MSPLRPRWFLVPLLLLACPASGGELRVGAGASVNLGSGPLALGCADLAVDGTFSAGSVGFTVARDVGIAPTGVLNGDSATLELARDWDNAGVFDAGTSTVRLVDGCGALSAVVAGDTTFEHLDLTTASGKLYRFESGSTQTVTNVLSLLGAMGDLLTIRSTLDGSEAFFDVQGISTARFVDVRDNDASGGNPIALGPDSLKGPNTAGWRLAPLVPIFGQLGLAMLALALLWGGRRALSRAEPPAGVPADRPGSARPSSRVRTRSGRGRCGA